MKNIRFNKIVSFGTSFIVDQSNITSKKPKKKRKEKKRKVININYSKRYTSPTHTKLTQQELPSKFGNS
jgi:hypothetical protein